MEAALVALILMALLFLSVRFKVLDTPGNLGSLGIGLIIGLYGGVVWLLLLQCFVILGFLGTKYKYHQKEKRGVAEKRGGKRGWYNVVANGLVPTFIAFFRTELGDVAFVMFLSALSVATADTLASEIGVLSDKVYLITKPSQKIKPGIDGGVSLLGQQAALLGAFLITVAGLILFPLAHDQFEPSVLNFLVPLTMGFTGCQIDSVLGATLEQRGYLGKGGVNFVSIALGSILAGLLVSFF